MDKHGHIDGLSGHRCLIVPHSYLCKCNSIPGCWINMASESKMIFSRKKTSKIGCIQNRWHIYSKVRKKINSFSFWEQKAFLFYLSNTHPEHIMSHFLTEIMVPLSKMCILNKVWFSNLYKPLQCWPKMHFLDFFTFLKHFYCSWNLCYIRKLQ